MCYGALSQVTCQELAYELLLIDFVGVGDILNRVVGVWVAGWEGFTHAPAGTPVCTGCLKQVDAYGTTYDFLHLFQSSLASGVN